MEYIIPLPEIIAEIQGKRVGTKGVAEEYQRVYSSLGDEFSILRSIPTSDIRKKGFTELANVIDRMRKGDVYIEPGYDGVYGVIKLFKDETERKQQGDQLSLL